MTTATLASPSDIARDLGVGRSSVYRWIERSDFPLAVTHAGGSRLWDLEQVREWHRATAEERRPGRPVGS